MSPITAAIVGSIGRKPHSLRSRPTSNLCNLFVRRRGALAKTAAGVKRHPIGCHGCAAVAMTIRLTQPRKPKTNTWRAKLSGRARLPSRMLCVETCFGSTKGLRNPSARTCLQHRFTWPVSRKPSLRPTASAEPLLHENPETKLKKAENQERRLLGKISTQNQKVTDGNKRWGEASEQHCEAESRAAEYNNQLVSLRIGMAALANRVAGLQPEVAIAAGRKSHAEAVRLLAELSSAITELASHLGWSRAGHARGGHQARFASPSSWRFQEFGVHSAQ